MVIKQEQLLESLLDLERARKRERDIRVEAEALLAGLRGIAGAREQDELFHALVDALHNVISFDQAFIIHAENENEMSVIATTFDAIAPTVWEPGSVFRKAVAGRPIASFDITQVPEWKSQPDDAKKGITSALHIGLHGGERDAILIITHPDAKHFGPEHVKKARRFSPLVAQALLTLELQKAYIQRDRFFMLSLDVMAIFDANGAIKQFNDGWMSILGYDLHKTPDVDIYSFVHPEEIETLRTITHHLNKKGGKELVELRIRKRNGSYLWFSCSLASYQDERLLYFVARDFTDRVTFEQRLAHSAGHDSLTGLKNRAEFMEALKKVFWRRSQEENYEFAILFLDLNKFKMINDSLGHDVGDELLKYFAGALQEVVRENDLVARLGGDEFTIILGAVQSRQEVAMIATRIQEKFTMPVTLKGHRLTVSTSIGIALSKNGFTDEKTMLKAADQAMYKAKLDQDLHFVFSH